MNERRTEMADGVTRKLEAAVANGLDSVYSDINDWLFDLWPDFSWNDADCVAEIDLVLADPRFNDIKTGFQTQFAFDIEAELRDGRKLKG